MATFGEKAVGLQPNAVGTDAVSKIKQLYATIIDELNALGSTSTSTEQKTLLTQSITQARLANLSAIDAITWKD